MRFDIRSPEWMDILRIVHSLREAEQSLTAQNEEDADVLHTEALMDGEFFGVFESVIQGVIAAKQAGAQRYQMNYIPFPWKGRPAGYYIYCSWEGNA